MAITTGEAPGRAPPDRRPVVLVTGGSRGIGLALARGFAARGHDLFLIARDGEHLHQAAAAITAQFGVRVGIAPCDLAQPGEVPRMLAALDAASCAVDILVNCAGVAASGSFIDNDATAARMMRTLNIEVATDLMHACLPAMVARGRGGVLNVASLAGMTPMPYLALYGATKSYLIALSRAVATEVAGTGVTVSVLLPGPVDTGIFAQSLQASERRTALLPALSPEVVARTAIEGYLAGQTVITPGLLGSLCRLGLKLLPYQVLAPFVGRALRGSSAAALTTCPSPVLSSARNGPVGPPTTSARTMRLRRLLRSDGHILVLALVAVVFVLQVCALTRKIPHADGAVVGIAASLLDHGIHANAPEPGSTAKPAPSRSMAPGYPALVAAVAALDRRMAQSLRCIAAGGADCLERNSLRALLVLNTLAVLIALALACFLARELSGSVEIAGLATLLMFIMGRFTDFVDGMSHYPIVLMLALGVCALLVVAHRRSSLPVAALAGLALGVLALFEVYYALMLVPVALLLLAAERWRAVPQWRFGLGAAAAFAVAGGLAIAPWMARNYVLFGDAALVQGTDAQLLAARIAYNSLSAGELLAGLLCWLPGIGDLSSLVLSAETRRKFDVYHDGSLLQEGARLFAATYTAKVPGSGSEGQSWYLLQTYVLADPLRHAASSLLLTLRGLRATGGLLVLWGWLALPLLLRRLRAHRGQGPFMLVAGPLVGIAVVQALLTPNLPWMNLGLVFVYAYAIAAVTGGLELPIALRRLMASRDGVEHSGAPYPARARSGAWPAAAQSAT